MWQGNPATNVLVLPNRPHSAPPTSVRLEIRKCASRRCKLGGDSALPANLLQKPCILRKKLEEEPFATDHCFSASSVK
jgi:hypothetical protein